jgi:very-short-patch-repair endonuclease
LGKYILKYPHRNIQTARMLRKTMTDVERKVWSKLRSNQLGVKFRRQVPFSNYIADFISLEVRLVIELDGCQHYQKNAVQQDKLRDQYFAKKGFTVLRFNNTEVIENMDGVLEIIWQKLQKEKDQRAHPNLPLKGKEM